MYLAHPGWGLCLIQRALRCSRQSCITLMCALWVCIPGCGCIQTDLGCPRVVQGSSAQLRWEPTQTCWPGQSRSLRCQWVEKLPWWPRNRARCSSSQTAVVVPQLKHPHTPGLVRNTHISAVSEQLLSFLQFRSVWGTLLDSPAALCFSHRHGCFCAQSH